MRTRFSTLKKREPITIDPRGFMSPPENRWNSFSVAATRRDYEEKAKMKEIGKRCEVALKRNQEQD